MPYRVLQKQSRMKSTHQNQQQTQSNTEGSFVIAPYLYVTRQEPLLPSKEIHPKSSKIDQAMDDNKADTITFDGTNHLPKVLRSYQKHSDSSPFISAEDLLNLESAGRSVLLKDDEEEDASKSTLQAVLVFFYVLTGVLQPILIEVLTYNGACEKTTFLFLLPTYVGMTLSIVANFDAWNQGKIRWMRLSILLLIDLGSGILCFTGLVNAGSAIFTVVYSSVTVYTALFSWLFFGRQLHYMQWGGVCLVMLGLLSSSFGSNMFSGADNEDVGLGILMIMVGSMFHSLYYIVSESVLKDDNPIAPEFLGTFQGIFGTTVFGLWQLLYTIPRWETLISDEIALHNGDVTEIICTYIGLVIVNFIHGICLFYMLKMVGSTTTGVLKGVISVAVFIISHFAFCSLQQSQCFSVAKGFSLVVVVLGVLCYSSYKLNKEGFPEELRPKRRDLLSRASTVWIHRQPSRDELALLLKSKRNGGQGSGPGSGPGQGPKMKKVISKTMIPFT